MSPDQERRALDLLRFLDDGCSFASSRAFKGGTCAQENGRGWGCPCCAARELLAELALKRSSKGHVPPRMHAISSFDSVSGRHAAYQRELERLACEVEDYLPLLEDGKADGVKHTIARLTAALERVYKAARVEEST